MNWTTFNKLPYTRPDTTALTEQLKQAAAALPAASAEETLQIFRQVHDAMQKLETEFNIAYIRHTVDTADAFYTEEVSFFDEALPHLDLISRDYHRALLSSPHRALLEESFGALYFKSMEEKLRLSRAENVENQVEENRLVQEYASLAAKPTVDFHGETCNFYGLLKKMQSTDRALRKEALTAWAGLYESIADQLDDIYTRMIQNRLRQAEVLGFEDYEQMVFLQMERFDYTREDIARFREAICHHVVPAAAKIFREQQKKLGVTSLHYYDESLTDPAGNIQPQGNTTQLLDAASELYKKLSPETDTFFSFMREHDLFDLETKPGKHQGGYCTFLPDLGAPFIFSNFNQTTADIDVLTHEAGHAFESFTASRAGIPYDVVFATAEVAEIHSMSMELLTYPWIDLFFGGDTAMADRYRKEHLQDALCVLPYMACVDEFQEQVYLQKMTDAGDRYALWHRLEQKYLPWRDYDGIEFLEKGGFWLQKQHIFMNPFYYIDYALAQMGALDFFLRAEEDRDAAWKDYLALCRAGGSKPYRELLAIGGLMDPFREETIRTLVEKVMEYIAK